MILSPVNKVEIDAHGLGSWELLSEQPAPKPQPNHVKIVPHKRFRRFLLLPLEV